MYNDHAHYWTYSRTNQHIDEGYSTYYDIDINTFEGMIDGDLVVYEKGGNPNDGFVLYGFDEVGMFDDEFTNLNIV